MNGDDEIDALAGEYVLGTLDAAERASVSARRLREPRLDAAIQEWTRRFSPLDQQTAAIEPPPGLLSRIEARIADAGAATLANVVDLAAVQAQLRVWKRLAIAAGAMAATLLVVVGAREFMAPPSQPNFVGVFQTEDGSPAFYLTVDLQARVLTLRPVNAARQPGKTYQLWIASDQLGPAPQSLGLVDENLADTRKSLQRYDIALLRKATFGVSVEPAGGSPTGQPTPPALHTKLLPIAN